MAAWRALATQTAPAGPSQGLLRQRRGPGRSGARRPHEGRQGSVCLGCAERAEQRRDSGACRDAITLDPSTGESTAAVCRGCVANVV